MRVVCLTPVVQRVNNVIPRINHYPVDDIQALLGVLGYGIFSKNLAGYRIFFFCILLQDI